MFYKKIIGIFSVLLLLISCGSSKSVTVAKDGPIRAEIDLVAVDEDRVKVTIDPGRFTSKNTSFFIPKTVPGTYSLDDYGQYIEDFKAFDYNGQELMAVAKNLNEWYIEDAANLDKVTYFVNDTYDTETQTVNPVFSPAGTNIEQGKNFVLNLHGFIGYFEDNLEQQYMLQISSPEHLRPVSSLNADADTSTSTVDRFYAKRYFEIIDNPIMYNVPNASSFMVDDIEITISVYSPNGLHAAEDIRPSIEKMMRAQKQFLGEVNGTKHYTILLYLSEIKEDDAIGFGALEHHTSTVAVLPEQMPIKDLEETLIDLISHEFFHIVTPLNVHSKEIQYFNFNEPKMSKHLWMYEGTTEYFANLFQIQQGLIDEQEFLNRMAKKIDNSKMYQDNLSFTEMSVNILEKPYKSNYANVYEKGALINMCLDILLRDLSEGEKGVLWLMKKLSLKYDQNTPFEDDKIIREIVQLTYPEIGEFFETHVLGDIPINYNEILNRVGLKLVTLEEGTSYFFFGEEPFIDARPDKNKTIFVRKGITLNSFFMDLGIKGGDTIVSIDGAPINLDTISPIIGESFGWKPNKQIVVVLERDGKEITVSGEVGKPTRQISEIVPVDAISQEQTNLRNLWFGE